MATKAKKKEPEYDKEQYEMNINEPMMFLIQQLTGDSTMAIVQYFHDLMIKQRREILVTNKGANTKNKYYNLFQKKSYGYYPGTKVYFTIVTSRKEEEMSENHGIYGDKVVGRYTRWVSNVSLPRGNFKLDHEELKKVLAEGILIGDAAIPSLPAPDEKKSGRRDVLDQLDDITDSTED